MKKISEFLSENFPFLVVKFSVYLNRLVFLMILRTQTVFNCRNSYMVKVV